MTGWAHAAESLVVRWCMAPGPASGYCGCTEPTPDPASPCGIDRCDGETAHWSWTEPGTLTEPGAYCQHEERWDCHPYVPAKCTCGHAIQPIGDPG